MNISGHKPVGVKWLRAGFVITTALFATVLTLVALNSVDAHTRLPDGDDSEDEAIRYRQSQPDDAIARLQKEIDAGHIHLTSNGRQGVLLSLLKQLKIPVESQLLVFSKTSFQRELIAPTNPRALYFNDHTYIGWVQGSSILEAATMDPRLGMVFYTADQDSPGKLVFKRGTDECLQCHETTMSNKVPGNIMRSVFTHVDGQPEYSAGTYLTDDSSPMEERWGGWYVTGTHGGIRHMGNVTVRGERENITIDRGAGANVTNLARFFQTSHYLQPTSDIVALMVAEHQTRIQNLIIRAGYQTRIAERYDAALNRDLNRPEGYHSDSMHSRIVSVCEPLVKGILFTDEPPLANPIVGSNHYTAQFESLSAINHEADRRERSLRELDLKRRLMRYRCSYMIYSDAFRALPARAREYVFQRLIEVLTGKDTSKPFAILTAATEERAAILDILTETDPEFAAFRKTNPTLTP